MTQTIKEYAEALFCLAKEENRLSEISDSLDTVSKVLNENPEYLDFLTSPNIKKEDRIQAIEDAFSGSIEEYVVSFLCLLCEKGRFDSIHICISEFKAFCDMVNRVSVAQVTSAVELDENEKSALKAKLESVCGNSVILECFVDPSVVGGLIVCIDGKIIDGSIRNKLHELKGVMYGEFQT